MATKLICSLLLFFLLSFFFLTLTFLLFFVKNTNHKQTFALKFASIPKVMRMHDATGKPLDARVMGDKRYGIVPTGNHQIIKTFGRQSFAFGQTFHYNSKVIRVLIVLDRSDNGTERDVFFQSLFLPTTWEKKLQIAIDFKIN